MKSTEELCEEAKEILSAYYESEGIDKEEILLTLAEIGEL